MAFWIKRHTSPLATLSQHSLKIIIVIPVEDKRRIQILADALHDTEVQLLA
jgi:hypothetical protein